MYACAGYGDTVSGRKRQNGGVERASTKVDEWNPRTTNATFSRHSSRLYIKNHVYVFVDLTDYGFCWILARPP